MKEMKVPKKESSESNYQYAVRVLNQKIMCLELEPGEIIVESELIELLKLGRTPIREAIMRLRDYRLVEVFPKKSSFVSKIDLDYVEEGVLIRESIETNILRHLITNISATYINLLKNNLKQQEEALEKGDIVKMWNLDNAYHKIMFLAASKPWSWEIVTQSTTHLDRVRYLMLKAGMYSGDTAYTGHVEIFNLILSGEVPVLDGYLYNQITSCYRKTLPELMSIYVNYFKLT